MADLELDLTTAHLPSLENTPLPSSLTVRPGKFAGWITFTEALPDFLNCRAWTSLPTV